MGILTMNGNAWDADLKGVLIEGRGIMVEGSMTYDAPVIMAAGASSTGDEITYNSDTAIC